MISSMSFISVDTFMAHRSRLPTVQQEFTFSPSDDKTERSYFI
jgi:hypothetical protein